MGYGVPIASTEMSAAERAGERWRIGVVLDGLTTTHDINSKELVIRLKTRLYDAYQGRGLRLNDKPFPPPVAMHVMRTLLILLYNAGVELRSESEWRAKADRGGQRSERPSGR